MDGFHMCPKCSYITDGTERRRLGDRCPRCENDVCGHKSIDPDTGRSLTCVNYVCREHGHPAYAFEEPTP